MIVRVLGNLTAADGMEYADQSFYEVTDQFVKENKQNVLTFSAMDEATKELAKKSEIKKPYKQKSFESANKMETGKQVK